MKKKRKCRGTGPYIPHLEHFQQRDRDFEGNGKDEKGRREIKTDPEACTPRAENFSDENRNSNVFNFSVEEFPLLPGSNPIPIKASEPSSPKGEQVKETSTSLDSLEFGSLKYSPPKSVSQAGKQLDSDVPCILDSTSGHPLGVEEEKESSKNEGNLVVVLQPLELKDEKEFPPLGPPAKPEIMLSKKEFPPLGLSSKLEKRGKWKKSFKEDQKGEKKQVK